MIVTNIEKDGKNKYKVDIDGEYVFSLYYSELKKFGIEIDVRLEESEYDDLFRGTVIHRAKKKALYILERMDRSEEELRRKLHSSGYPEKAVEEAVAYVKSYHYIDDEKYAKSYIQARTDKKSKRQIEQELRARGVTGDYVKELLSDTEGEEEAVKRLIARKTQDVSTLSPEEKKKLAASLFRKGFTLDCIRRQLDLSY